MRNNERNVSNASNFGHKNEQIMCVYVCLCSRTYEKYEKKRKNKKNMRKSTQQKM